MENVRGLFEHPVDEIDERVDDLTGDLIKALLGARRKLAMSHVSFARKLGLNPASWESIRASAGARKLHLKTIALIAANSRGAELAIVHALAMRAAKGTLAARALNTGLVDAHTYRLLMAAEAVGQDVSEVDPRGDFEMRTEWLMLAATCAAIIVTWAAGQDLTCNAAWPARALCAGPPPSPPAPPPSPPCPPLIEVMPVAMPPLPVVSSTGGVVSITLEVDDRGTARVRRVAPSATAEARLAAQWVEEALWPTSSNGCSAPYLAEFELEFLSTIELPLEAPTAPVASPIVGETALPERMVLARPNQRTINRFYPRRAMERNVEGSVTLDCIVERANGALACTIETESPARAGFGRAALRIAREIRADVNGSTAAAGQSVLLPVVFSLDADEQ